MKTSILFISLLMASLFGFTAFAQEIYSGPAIRIDKETHNYGTLEYGANSDCAFTVTNIGTEPLIIAKAQPSCGCTQPVFSSEPIAPGESATIKVSYDTNRVGDFTKSITIMSNAVNEGTKIVYIKGTVLPQAVETSPNQSTNGSGTPTTPTNNGGNGSAVLITPKN
jgi:hypothetical protein